MCFPGRSLFSFLLSPSAALKFPARRRAPARVRGGSRLYSVPSSRARRKGARRGWAPRPAPCASRPPFLPLPNLWRRHDGRPKSSGQGYGSSPRTLFKKSFLPVLTVQDGCFTRQDTGRFTEVEGGGKIEARSVRGTHPRTQGQCLASARSSRAPARDRPRKPRGHGRNARTKGTREDGRAKERGNPSESCTRERRVDRLPAGRLAPPYAGKGRPASSSAGTPVGAGPGGGSLRPCVPSRT